MNRRIPNMVVMEKSSFNDVDTNAMTESAFAWLAEGAGDVTAEAGDDQKAQSGPGDAGVRFAAAAWRDHVVALTAHFLGDR